MQKRKSYPERQFLVYNAEILLWSRTTQEHEWLKGLSSIQKKNEKWDTLMCSTMCGTYKQAISDHNNVVKICPRIGINMASEPSKGAQMGQGPLKWTPYGPLNSPWLIWPFKDTIWFIWGVQATKLPFLPYLAQPGPLSFGRLIGQEFKFCTSFAPV